MACSATPSHMSSTPSLVAEESPFSPSGDSIPISITIRQDPLSITLDGAALLVLSLSLIFTVHFFQAYVVVLLIAFVTVVIFIHNDYRNYLNLGPGGTPATFSGYTRINWLKLWALRDPFEPVPSDPSIQPSSGILRKQPLPYRCGPWPRVVGIAPQRQVNQFGSRECYLALRRILENHGQAHSNEIGVGTSCFEKHGLGLFSRYPFNKTCQGEICHVHNSDHSLHLSLHPDDAKEVLEKGWGQRHPLTSRCFGLLKMPVPRQFTMVYAPRSRDELKVVCQIIDAAGWWVTAKETPMDLLGEI
ncbi:hypothetical protein F5Y16DRAFT_13853 [Xylariaceae sp. FL0255]|nr:hypothetical protein F5Y16DRAFT_13853 [Xylariaceae sp. FL0255]